MKRSNRIPLRWRITLMTGAVVFVSNFLMMLVSIYYANSGFDVVMTNVNYYYQSVISESAEEVMVTAAAADTAEASSVIYSKEETEVLHKSAENKSTGKNIIIVEDPQFFHITQAQEDLQMFLESDLTDADAASSTVYFPDNSSVSKTFNLISVLTMCATTIMGMVIAYGLSYRALKPIRQLNESVLSITDNNLNRRVEESVVKDEVGSLQKSFNGMMDRLEASFNRQKEFSRNVAHELKTPLTTMKTGIQVLRMDDHPSYDEMEQVLCVTEKNIDRLISIVQDLLLFTKEEHVEFNDEIHIDHLMTQILQEQSKTAEKMGVTLHLESDQDIVLMQNESLLTRALTNLIENAIKYNRKGGKVDVSVKKLKHEVCIEIEDTGIGMDEAHLGRIWDPFYCVDESRSRKLGGAGIGLALVKSISEKCGLEVSVVSEKEKGSIFSVKIPLKHQNQRFL